MKLVQNRLVQIAKEIAEREHAKQMYGDKPYMFHIEGVVENFIDTYGNDHIGEAVAWLHDVAEDTDFAVVDIVFELLERKVPDSDIEAVGYALDHITRRTDESYAQYIARLATNAVAVEVKKADLRFNISQSKPGTRRDKYELALLYLEDAPYLP
jgi:hypothetical protein